MDSFELMQCSGIKLSAGLSAQEFEKIWNVYGICFPVSLKRLFSQGVPIGNNFYNWHDFSNENIQKIKMAIIRPKLYIFNHIDELEWLDSRSFSNATAKREESKMQLDKAPMLIPLYGHRYLPMIDALDPPVISVHGFDIVYYGKNINDWIRNEFLYKNNSASFSGEMQFVPFWSEIC